MTPQRRKGPQWDRTSSGVVPESVARASEPHDVSLRIAHDFSNEGKENHQ
jgi:hypothetical protein